MKKDNFQPIVMPCTREQYESLIPVLEEHLHKNNSLIEYRLNGHTIYSMKSITNNHNCKKGFVSFNTLEINDYFHIHKCKRKVYKRFNRKIFLKSLGIVEEPEFVLPEKWCVKSNNYQELEIITKHFYGYLLHIDPKSYVTKNGLDNHPGHSNYNFWNYTEITFEQFQKHVLKQDQSILESQLATNKQTNTMVKVKVEESQPKEKIHKGCLVKWRDVIGVVTSTNNYKIINIISVSNSIGQTYNVNMEVNKVSLFKGKLTLEQ